MGGHNKAPTQQSIIYSRLERSQF